MAEKMSQKKKKHIPPYLAIMMLNPCETNTRERGSPPDQDEMESICSENAPLMSKSSKSHTVYDKETFSSTRRVHIKSWAVLAMYFFVTISVNSSWCLFAPVTSIIQDYYNVNSIAASLLSLTYPLMFIVTGSLVQRLLFTYSPSALLLLAAFVHALGTAVRCKGTNRDGFAILLIGQSICGLAAAPTLCLSYSVHILCRNYRTKGCINTFVIVTNIIGVSIGFFATPFAINDTEVTNKTGWDIYRYTLCLAVISVFILVVVPFTLKGLSLSLSLDEYDPTSRNETIKRDEFEKHLLSVTLVMSRISVKDVLRNIPLQLIVNAFGLCFADAFLYVIFLSNILHENIAVVTALKIGSVGFASLMCGLVTGVGLRLVARRYSAAKNILLFLVCQSAVFDLMFVILQRFKINETTVLVLYCVSQISSISALIIYADQISTVKTVPTGTSTFVLILSSSIYGLLAGLIGSVVLSLLGETPMLAVTEVASLAAIILTYFFERPPRNHKWSKADADSVSDDATVTVPLSRRNSMEGNYV